MCCGLRLYGQTRQANLSVPVDGGPNTLSGVLLLDHTHGKISKENTDLRLVQRKKVVPFLLLHLLSLL